MKGVWGEFRITRAFAILDDKPKSDAAKAVVQLMHDHAPNLFREAFYQANGALNIMDAGCYISSLIKSRLIHDIQRKEGDESLLGVMILVSAFESTTFAAEVAWELCQIPHDEAEKAWNSEVGVLNSNSGEFEQKEK